MRRVAGRWCRVKKISKKAGMSPAAGTGVEVSTGVGTGPAPVPVVFCATRPRAPKLRQHQQNPKRDPRRVLVYDIPKGETLTVRGVAYHRTARGELRRAG